MSGCCQMPATQPDDAELKMLGALLFQCIRQAWLTGVEQARFRGYCVEARRIDCADGAHPRLVLTLWVLAAVPQMQDRLFLAVAPYPVPGAGCDIRLERVPLVVPYRSAFPVG